MISIIIPTYNERENTVNIIKTVRSILIKNNLLFEIIVVDDNSPDGTARVVAKKFPNDKKVRLFVRRENRSLGASILFGIKKSKGDIIVGMDADFNHPPDKIPKLISTLDQADLAIASRFIKGGGMEDKRRHFFTYLFNLFLKYILGFPTMDNMSGFYAIKKNKLRKLPLEKIYRGYGEYHLRLIHFAQQSRLKIKEAPVFYMKRKCGKSKSNLLNMFLSYLSTAFGLKLNNADV